MNFKFSFGRLRSILSLSVAVCVVSGSLAPMLNHVKAQTPPVFVQGEMLVKLRPNLAASALQDLYARTRITPLERLGNSGWIRVRTMPNQSIPQLAPYLRQFPQVEMAEPNYIVHADGIPNDPNFSKLWGLHNTGQTGGTSGVDIDAPEAWDNFTPAGNTVVVAVIDTGIDYTHPDLSSRVWANPREVAGNGQDDDGNGYIDDVRGWDFVSNDNDPMDDNNHGTHVSGTIAAAFNNGTGVAGVVGPANVRIMPLKFLDSSGSGSTSAAIKALDYATANGAVISNNSWGGGSYSQALADAITRNHQAGRLFVAAAGNSSTNTDSTPYYPQGYDIPNVISVASMMATDTLSSFSNYGAKTVDLAAPGSSIYSTVKGGYALYSGTSMATPHVVGALALVWAKNPTLNNLQVKQTVLGNVRKAGYLSNYTVTGGVLNLRNAMLATATPGSPAPSPSPSPTPSPSLLPAAPTNLTAQPYVIKRYLTTYRYVKLTWKDNATNEASYEVLRSTSPTTGFQRIKQLSANTTIWTQSLGTASLTTALYYKVQAINSSGASGFSNTVTVNRF